MTFVWRLWFGVLAVDVGWWKGARPRLDVGCDAFGRWVLSAALWLLHFDVYFIPSLEAHDGEAKEAKADE